MIFNRKKETIDYNFSCLNPVDFELTFYLPCDNQIFNKILSNSLEKLKAKGYNTDNIRELNNIDIDPRYYNLIATKCSRPIAAKSTIKPISAPGCSTVRP